METAFLEPPQHPTGIKKKGKEAQPCAIPGEMLTGELTEKCLPQVEGGKRCLLQQHPFPQTLLRKAVFAMRAVPLDDRLLKNGSLKIALHL